MEMIMIHRKKSINQYEFGVISKMRKKSNKIGSCFILMVLCLSVTFLIPVVSADQIPNECYALVQSTGSDWSEINSIGHVEMGSTFTVYFNMSINEVINSIGLDNLTFSSVDGSGNLLINGTGSIDIGDILSSSPLYDDATDWSTNDQGYAAPFTVIMDSTTYNNTDGMICNTTWNARYCGAAWINFTSACGTSEGATLKPTNFYNATIYVHPGRPTSPSASAGSNQIGLSWTSGAGADSTVIMAKQNSLPTGLYDSGATEVYNNSGTETVHSGLGGSEHWYYRFYSYNDTVGFFSVLNTTDDDTTFDDTVNQPCINLDDELPSDGSTGIDFPSEFNITIQDPNGDTFNWSIETSPNVGSNSDTDDTNGSKSCSFTGIDFDTLYTVFVNATDLGNLTTQEWEFTFETRDNNAPTLTGEDPNDGAIDQAIALNWNITINDPDGDPFDWSIECSDGTTDSDTGDTNGSKSISLSGLSYSSLYTVYVNVTDGFVWTNDSFNFTTMDEPSNYPPNISSPNPTDGQSGVSRSLSSVSVTISDIENVFNWTIQGSFLTNSQGSNANNGSKTANVPSTLSYSTTYTWYVNVSDGYQWTNDSFTFTTEAAPNNPPNPPHDPDPENNAPDVPINIGVFSVIVDDPDGDSLDCYCYWDDHTLIDTVSSVSNGSTVEFDIPDLDLNTTYSWYVNVTDGEDITQSPIWTFNTSDNIPPAISFTSEYSNATRFCYFNDTSTDADGTVVFWTWDFGDSTADVNTEDVIHTYVTGGTYIVTLTIIDNNGGLNTTTDSITLNYDPVSSFLYTVDDLDITVTQTASDSDGTISNYTWTWGDGNYSYSANATHNYSVAGSYLVNLTVTDNQGATSSSYNAITVPPSASSGFTYGEVNWLLWFAIIAVLCSGMFFVLMIWRR